MVEIAYWVILALAWFSIYDLNKRLEDTKEIFLLQIDLNNHQKKLNVSTANELVDIRNELEKH